MKRSHILQSSSGMILGFVIALPLTMTVVEVFKYLRNSTRDGKIS